MINIMRKGCIVSQIPLILVPNDLLGNMPPLVQIMDWHRSGIDCFQYLETIWSSLLTHICDTRSRWVNEIIFKYIDMIPLYWIAILFWQEDLLAILFQQLVYAFTVYIQFHSVYHTWHVHVDATKSLTDPGGHYPPTLRWLIFNWLSEIMF